MKASLNTCGYDVQRIRQLSPIILNHTNLVSMSFIANTLTVIGASPIMFQAADEIHDLVNIAQAVVLNLGTLNHDWIHRCHLIQQSTQAHALPIVLDPVGVGASRYRREAALEVLVRGVDVVRGNASEILALVDACVVSGIDSSNAVESAIDAAQTLACRYDCVVVISGETDVITDGQAVAYNQHGSMLLTTLSGTGCALTAVIGAFMAVQANYFIAAQRAVEFYALCAEKAARQALGPGSFYTAFLDSLYAEMSC